MANYLLLDTAQCLRFHARLDQAGIPYASLYEDHPEFHLLDIAPLLISLNEQERRHALLREEIERIGARVPALSLIDSDANLNELSKHLRQFHLVGLPEGKRMLLRWYDTRILPTWLAIMTPAQRDGFLLPIKSWSYLDRYGRTQPVELYSQTSMPPPPTPYQLNTDQYQALMQAAQTDGVLAQLKRVIPDEIRRTSYQVLFPFLEHQVASARQRGIETIDDLVQYALLALYTSGRFVEHPVVAQGFSGNESVLQKEFTDWALSLPDDF